MLHSIVPFILWLNKILTPNHHDFFVPFSFHFHIVTVTNYNTTIEKNCSLVFCSKKSKERKLYYLLSFFVKEEISSFKMRGNKNVVNLAHIVFEKHSYWIWCQVKKTFFVNNIASFNGSSTRECLRKYSSFSLIPFYMN